MKKLSIIVCSIIFLTLFASSAMAAPDNSNKVTNNPNVVAYYPTGIHAIPSDPVTYVTGTDLVTTRGNSGQIEAWYTGDDGHGIHSAWNISKNGTCSNNSVLIAHAYPEWGDYLTPNADYCVQNNAF